MGKLLWMIATGVAGYFGFRRLQGREKGIGREVAREERGREQSGGAAGPAVSSPEREPEPMEASSSLEERIMRRISETPGILQTELYVLFPEENRRVLQETIRNMERKGGVRRTREGGTYRLVLA